MQWEYSDSGNCWIASRPMWDGVCNFIYTIFPMMGVDMLQKQVTPRMVLAELQ